MTTTHLSACTTNRRAYDAKAMNTSIRTIWNLIMSKQINKLAKDDIYKWEKISASSLPLIIIVSNFRHFVLRIFQFLFPLDCFTFPLKSLIGTFFAILNA